MAVMERANFELVTDGTPSGTKVTVNGIPQLDIIGVSYDISEKHIGVLTLITECFKRPLRLRGTAVVDRHQRTVEVSDLMVAIDRYRDSSMAEGEQARSVVVAALQRLLAPDEAPGTSPPTG